MVEEKEIIDFWTDLMNDSEVDENTRLRASENLAKLRGMFKKEDTDSADKVVNINLNPK